MKEALFFLLKTFLKKEGFAVNFDELKLQLLSHPSYPSLHSVTGVLSHFDIDNMALEVPQNKETLEQLPKYFISMTSDKDQFVVVTKSEESIELLYGDKKKKTYSIDEFLDIWSGIIVVAEKETIERTDPKVDDKTASNALLLLSGLLVIGLFFISKPALFESTYFILSLIGVSVSALIVKHELGFHSKAVDKFCSATESSSCDAVLNSSGASIIGTLKLSDLSIMYFSALALTSLLTILFSTDYSALIVLTVLALPITIYSIYYQYWVVKKWCPLCLGIVVVLWLQCCSLFLSSTNLTSIKFDPTSNFILFFSFILTAAIWMYLKPLLKKQQELVKLEIAHIKFKRNFSLFNAVYSKSESYNTTINTGNEIILGAKKAPINILIATNPACYHCKAAHDNLEKLLKKNSNDINVTFRFNVSSNEEDTANRTALRLLEVYNTQPYEICKEALHEAYANDADLNSWLSKWGEASDKSANDLLKLQRSWCHENNINFTPALFINGKSFPKEYEGSDILYFIEDLMEETGIEIGNPGNLEIAN